MNRETKLKRKDSVLTADMEGSAVTMDMETGKYYDLGTTGGVIWNFLENEKTFEELLSCIVSEYDVTREQCEADVEAFLNKLISDGLVIAK